MFKKLRKKYHKLNDKLPLTAMVLVILAAAISAFALSSFVIVGGYYIGGVSGMALYAQNLINPDNDMLFTIFYYGLNLPLVVFGFIKIGKKFTLLTLLYVVLVPIFKEILVYDGFFESVETSLFLIAVSGGLIYGFSIALAYVAQASTGGMDFVSMYYATKKGVKLGIISIIVNYTIILFGQIALSRKNGTGLNGVLNDTLLYTLIFIFIVGVVLDRIYPRSEKIEITCVTREGKKIVKHFKSIEYIHGITYHKTYGSRAGTENEKLSFAALYLEHASIIENIKLVDPDAFIMMHKLQKISGNFNLK